MKKPLVSIITPCYNGEKFLDRYFDSVLNQTYSNIELIFVNDGSTDRTEEIALKYKKKMLKKNIRFIYLKQENLGQAAALNLGLKYFSGEYLTWPDSDDEMTSDCIEKKVCFLEKNQQYGFCICKIKVVNENNLDECKTIQRNKPEGKDTFFEDLIYVRNLFFVPGGYMVRSKDFLSINPNKEIYTGRGGQNSQILLPMSYYFKCGYMQEVLFTYYVRENSHSHSIIDAEKIINQLYLYENILIETLKRIDKKVYLKYLIKIKEHYARLRFGNSIDTKNDDIIKKCYSELKKVGKVRIHEYALYLKYTNGIIKSFIKFMEIK